MRMRIIGLILLLLVVATACQQEQPPPAATSTGATTPSVAAATNTPAGAIATPTAAPGVPPAPTPIPTATQPAGPTPTTAPQAVSLMTPEDFGTDRNRLTGELVEDPAVLQRRPIAVKISNAPATYTRPQAGLSDADLVFEHVTEGPITRFTAIIYSKTPPNMGPIRSARLIDVELPAMYDAALAYSGSSIGVANKLFSSDFRGRILRSNEPGYYRTGEDKPYEHTLYGRPESFWESLDQMGENVPPTFATQMVFASETPAGGTPASELSVNYRDWTIVNWRYDEESGRYFRWADGEAHIDKNYDDVQISAANVVVILAPHQQDFNICEHQTDTGCQAFATESQIWGQGPVLIFRDGEQFTGTWKREQRPDMFTFYDDQGNPIPLQIGNTWFQVVPLHYTDPISVTP